MQMDPCQGFAIRPKALQLALLVVPEGLSSAKKCHSNGLKLFGCIAATRRTILLVYRERNLGHWAPCLLAFRRKSDPTKRTHRK